MLENILLVVDNLEALLFKYIGQLGFDLDKSKCVFYLFTCIPLACLMRFIKNPLYRNLYNLFWGVFFFIFFTKEWSYFVLCNILLVYLIVSIFKAKSFWIVFIVSFSFLSYCHVYRLIYDYLSWKMDYNTIQMIMTCRQIYYALQTKDHNFVNYSSYMFMFTNLIIGPIPYKEFLEFMELTGNYSKIPLSFKSTLISFFKAIMFSIGEILLRPIFEVDLFSVEWMEKSVIEKQFRLLPFSVCQRFKYFGAFMLTQTSLDALGITYNEENNQFDRFPTASCLQYELETNMVIKTNYWNSLVQHWLKVCFYEQFSKKLGSMAFYVVFLISAVWHGFYLTYYFMFFWWAVILQICKLAYKQREQYKKIPNIVRNIIGQLYISICINQMAICVMLLDWGKAIQFTNDIKWSGQILMTCGFIFFYLRQPRMRSHKKE